MSIPHRIRTEAFAGAGSILLHMPRCYAEVLNDRDGEIVNLFRVLRDRRRSAELIRLMRLTPYAREEFEGSYKPISARCPKTERARRFLVRSWMAFSSRGATSPHRTGFRANCGRSTTPATDWSRLPGAFGEICERLQGVLIEHADAAAIIRRYDAPDALHFVDPPYVYSTRPGGARRGYRHELDDEQHRALAECLHGCKGAWVICGYPSDLYDQELFSEAHRLSYETYSESAQPRVEVCWSNRPIIEQATLW
jgi:DNA adenine methylase